MTLTKEEAMKKIEDFFEKYMTSAEETLKSATNGKIYELFCLVKTVKLLKTTYDLEILYVPRSDREDEKHAIDFKFSPGHINRDRSYFLVKKLDPASSRSESSESSVSLELHVDIEVETLSQFESNSLPQRKGAHEGSEDLSGYHEIDLVLIDPKVKNHEKPRHNQLILGVECKATKSFKKSIVREVLGVRRELSLFTETPQRCKLDRLFEPPRNKETQLNACPASRYILAFADPKGEKYSNGPAHFGIEFKNWPVTFSAEDGD